MRHDKPAGKSVFAVAVVGKQRYYGENSYKTHPEMLTIKGSGIRVAYAHAELQSLMRVPRQARRNVTLFVCRLTRDGRMTMAKPCGICQAYLLREGVDLRQVYYTDWNGEWQKLI